MEVTLTGSVHGHAKVGKSWLLDTLPSPRLIIDAEGGSRFTPSKKVLWDPKTSAPPEYDGTWETCLVYGVDWSTLDQTYQWLISGQHPFAGVGHDNMTDIQQRIITHFNGTQALREADWGTLLRHCVDYVQKHRDLVFLPNNTVRSVWFACATQIRDERVVPYLSGQFRDKFPYMTDVVGYLYIEQPEDSPLRRRLLINPIPPFVAGDRTHTLTQHYGSVIDNPSIQEMMEVLT